MTYYQYKKIDYWNRVFNKYQPRAYVCYSSYRNNDETVMTQVCNKNNKTTFTFQNYNIPEFKEFNYESITYENFISDYFLLWGEANYDVLKKFIDDKKLLLAGHPNYGKAKEIKRTRFNPKKCTFFLSHPSYKSSNLKLLEIMNKFSKQHPEIKFYMNLHPDNNEEEHKKKIESNNIIFLSNDNITKEELLEGNDFIILYNSTLVLEALSLQIPLFRYKDESFIKMPVPYNNFSDLNELNTLFSKMLKPEEYRKAMKLNFKCYNNNFFYPKSGNVAENYKKLITENIK